MEEWALQEERIAQEWPYSPDKCTLSCCLELDAYACCYLVTSLEIHHLHVVQELELLQEGDRVMQKNEGQWHFSLDESSNGRSIELAIAVCRYLDTSLIRADVQPHFVRLLIQACPISCSHAHPVHL